MNNTYKKAIIIGLAALVVLVLLNYYTSYWADQDMKEYYKEPRLYDNDFVGIGWAFITILGTIIISILAGTLAVIWALNDIRGPVEALEVSAVAIILPGMLILAVVIILGVISGSYGPSPQITADSLRVSFTSGLFFLSLLFLIVCIAGSAIGSLFSYLLLSKMGSAGILVLDGASAVKAGMAGAAITIIVYLIGFYQTGGANSYVVLLFEFLIFAAVSALAGMLAQMLNHESRLTKGSVVTSIATGFIVGLGGIMGRAFFSMNAGHNGNILFTDSPGFIADGIVFTLLGTVLYFTLTTWKNEQGFRGISKLVYGNAAAVGICFGFIWLAIQTIIPLMQLQLLFLVYLASVIVAGMLSALLSKACTLGDAAAFSGITGGIGCIVLTLGDLLYAFLSRTDNTIISASLSEEIRASNMLSTLGWASVKVALILSLVCWAGIMYVSIFKKTEQQRTSV